MGKHNKKRKRGMKYHMLNLRLNEVEWGFLQTLKEKGVAMSEYIRTTMKTTPRYQDYIKMLYGTHMDEFSKLIPSQQGKPSLPTDKWNSVNVERDKLRDITGNSGMTVTEVLGSKHNSQELEITQSYKLDPNNKNSNRVGNPNYKRNPQTTQQSQQDSEPTVQRSKIDSRYE